MQIFVKTLSGETRVVNIAEGQTASEWKDLCAQFEGVDADLLTFVSEGSVLTDSDILSEKLSEEATVYVSLALDGGKKKKKRKIPTTKKKNKHKHQSVKLLTLKYYSVDNNNKITYQRKICPNCGPGYAMAKHFDRHYCGSCHVSLKLDAATIKANLAEQEKIRAAKLKLAAEKAAAGGADDGKGGKGKKDDGKKGKKGKK